MQIYSEILTNELPVDPEDVKWTTLTDKRGVGGAFSTVHLSTYTLYVNTCRFLKSARRLIVVQRNVHFHKQLQQISYRFYLKKKYLKADENIELSL